MTAIIHFISQKTMSFILVFMWGWRWGSESSFDFVRYEQN